LSKVSQLIKSLTFNKDRDYFEILIESGTNLIITYKDRDQFDGLLENFIIYYNHIQLEKSIIATTCREYFIVKKLHGNIV